MLLRSQKTRIILFRSMWMTSKMAGKKKKLMKDVDTVEPTSFLDHVFFGCTQRECKPNEKIIWTIQQDVRIPYFCWNNRKLPGWDKPRAKTSTWSCDVEGHARKCVERYCNFSRVLVLVWTITKSKRQNWKINVNCQKFALILY